MAKTAQNQQATQEDAAAGLPLFFKSPTPLDKKRHAEAGLLPVQDLSFASSTNSILINAVEFFEAAKQYPIVFTAGENPLPAVIVGLEKQNYFVDEQGAWKADAYLPAYVRKYPFVFMDMPERKEFLLCIDEAAPQFQSQASADALPLYKDGQPAELTKNALEFCTAYHNHHQLTRRFCEDLKKADLLTATRSDAKLFNGREIHLGGFLAIDEKKVNSLPDATVLDFFKKGWLPLIYSALMSGSNWKKLVDMAATREQA